MTTKIAFGEAQASKVSAQGVVDEGDIRFAALLDELTKIAAVQTPRLPKLEEPSLEPQTGFLDSAKDLAGRAGAWMRDNPIGTSVIGGGVTAGGVLGARSLPRAMSPIHSMGNLQRKARKYGLGIAVGTNAKSPQEALKIKDKLRAWYVSQGHTPIYTDSAGRVMDVSKKDAVRKVTVGLPGTNVSSLGEVQLGGLRQDSKSGKAYIRKAEEVIAGGKPAETAKDLGLSEHFAKGVTAGDIIAKNKIRPPGVGVEDQVRYLGELQEAFKNELGPQGFLLKPSDMVASSGNFPSEGKAWGEIWKDYTSRLKPEMEQTLRNLKDNPDSDYADDLMLAATHRDDPAYAGTALEAVMKDPSRTLAQQKLDILRNRSSNLWGYAGDASAPVEYRVHLMNGVAPDSLAYERYNFSRDTLRRIPLLNRLRDKSLGTPEDAARWVQENIAPKINKELGTGTLGLDVARVRNPDGSLSYKLIELNPSHPDMGGSGFLEPTINPVASNDLSVALTGKSSPLIGGATAAVGGVGGAGAGYGLSRGLEES